MLQALLLKYFDGKLYGTIYLAMKHGAKYEDHCFKKVLCKCIILKFDILLTVYHYVITLT
jgi:hypothetical protein